MRLLIAGCGDLGTRLGQRWIARGGQVVALRRNVAGLPAAFERHSVDLAGPLPAGVLPDRLDAVAWLATPDARTPDAYRRIYVDGLQRLLDRLPSAPTRLLLASSTAVYGEDAGEWVDEDTPATPRGFNGEVLLEAEAAVHRAASHASVARLSGLYGPGRDRLWRRARAGERGAPRWGNRIHVDDAAAALDALLSHDAAPRRVCISDDQPQRDDVVLDDLRRLLGLPALPPRPAAPESGKRVSNALLRRLGIALRFPDHLAGYAALLPAQRDPAALL